MVYSKKGTTEQVSLRIEKTAVEFLKTQASENEMSLAELMRKILIAYVKSRSGASSGEG